MNARRTLFRCASGVIVVGGFVGLEHNSKRRALNNIQEEEMVGSNQNTIRHKVSLLKKDGVCVLHQALSTEDLLSCKQMESFKASAEAKSNKAALTAAKFWQSTPGRYHRQHFSRADLETLAGLESSWLPLVTSYLPSMDGISPERTDVQLLVSLPGSKDQFFHQDNRRQGLTILIPLVNVIVENGPTQLLPRSHNLTAGAGEEVTSMDCSIMSTMVQVQSSIRACIPAGSAVVYDSRTLHRGLANTDLSQSRPALVFRYDYGNTLPPGHTVMSTILFRVLGNILCVVGEIKHEILKIV